ncbi:MAG TPA: hypothetical protein VG942_04710 [Hyphomonadaceae bacterium]|nr:hypothetical protein [Hyphomonadaceae bacterium]
MISIFRLVPLVLVWLSIGTATSQDGTAPRMGIDPKTGARVATTVAPTDTRKKNGYSLAAQTETNFWVEVRQETNGDVHVMFKGQQLHFALPEEAGAPGRYGPRPSEYPAYVGTPLTKATLTFPWLDVSCLDKSHWCNRIQAMQIDLDADQVRSMIAEKASATIAISISNKRRIEWRMPKADLIAALDALGVLGQFR